MSVTPYDHYSTVLYPSHNTRVSEPEPKYYTTETYALSGKIMLSAIIILFIVVVLIVSLHIYARSRRRNHLRRRRRRRNHLVVFTTDISPSAAAMRGLDPSVLKSLPTFTYSPMTSTNTNTTCPIQECAVCLSEFEENEKGRILPKCNHSFHIECIDTWFQSQSTCPLCRAPVTGIEPVEAEPPVQIVIDSAGVGSSGVAEMGSASSSNLMEDSKKRFMGSIEVPPRRNESFKGLEEEVGFKSPGGRIRSFKRMLSRDFRRPSTPSPRSCSTSSVATEIDLERGGEVEEHSVTPPTPPPPPPPPAAQQTT